MNKGQISNCLNVIPFNDLYYKDCIYNAYLSGIIFQGGSIALYLANELFYYIHRKDGNANMLCIENKEVCTPFKVALSMGILMERAQTEDVEAIIRTSVDNGNPVFLPVTAAFLSEEELEKREVHAFAILVFGYDINKKEYDIIAVNTAGCRHKKMEKDDLIGRCRNYRISYRNSRRKLYPSIIRKIHKRININQKMVRNEAFEVWKRNMIEREKDIFASLEMIKESSREYEQWFECRENMFIGKRGLPINFFQQKAAKKIERFRVGYFLPEQIILHEQMTKIIEKLNIAFVIWGKYLNMGISSKKNIRMGALMLMRAYELEVEFNEALFRAIGSKLW